MAEREYSWKFGPAIFGQHIHRTFGGLTLDWHQGVRTAQETFSSSFIALIDKQLLSELLRILTMVCVTLCKPTLLK